MSDRHDPRQYTAERAAKRAAIGERLAAEKAAADAAAFDARLLREAQWQEEELQRYVRRMQQHARLRCPVYGTWYDNCHHCQQQAREERAAEARANQ